MIGKPNVLITYRVVVIEKYILFTTLRGSIWKVPNTTFRGVNDK